MSEDNEWVVTATVRRWQLTETLRQLREQRGWTMDEAVQRLERIGGKWSSSKISRIENRQQGVKDFDVERLIDAYEVTDPNTREWIMGLSARAGERGYWLAIRKDLPEDFQQLLHVEATLLAVRQLETLVVPGLLQTPDYTRALVTGVNPGLDFEVAERRVLARMARQRVLNRPKPLRYHVILDESILTRPVGTAVSAAWSARQVGGRGGVGAHHDASAAAGDRRDAGSGGLVLDPHTSRADPRFRLRGKPWRGDVHRGPRSRA